MAPCIATKVASSLLLVFLLLGTFKVVIHDFVVADSACPTIYPLEINHRAFAPFIRTNGLWITVSSRHLAFAFLLFALKTTRFNPWTTRAADAFQTFFF